MDHSVVTAPADRRARRRQETIEEIVAIAEDVMNVEGVNGLSLSEVARRLGVKPPSIYKYFDSLMAIYDALFARGQQAHLEAMRGAVDGVDAGLPVIVAALEASGRWCIDHPALAQLMFLRPVPRFEPTDRAMAPSIEMVAMQRDALTDAVAAGQLGPGGDSDDAIWLVSTMVMGVISQTLANEPGLPWGKGRFSPMLATLLGTLPAVYPPRRGRGRS